MDNGDIELAALTTEAALCRGEIQSLNTGIILSVLGFIAWDFGRSFERIKSETFLIEGFLSIEELVAFIASSLVIVILLFRRRNLIRRHLAAVNSMRNMKE